MGDAPAGPSTLYGLDMGIPLGDRRVLIADDSAFNRRTLARFLQWAGITDIVFAASGEEALSMVGPMTPDLLLIDVAAPRMDGIAVCRTLRRDPRWRDLPVILQSAHLSDHLRAVGFQAGANDLIAKPVNPGECIARVRYHLERRAIEQELRAFHSRLERDLRQARAMQLALVPDADWLEALAARNGLTIEPVFQSSDEIGGDFWTAVEIDENHVGLFVADLSGHGLAAAINAFRLHTLLTRASTDDLRDPARLLGFLNVRLAPILTVGQFATAFYAVTDRRAEVLRYAAAGSPSPILARAGCPAEPLDGSGMLLGAFADADYDGRSVPFRSGDALFIYSDGLSEAGAEDGAMLGEAGVAALVERARAEAPDHPFAWMMGRFAELFGTRLLDDLTALWIHRR